MDAPAPPDFLVIGAQKAGTTWLHRSLRAHPRLWLPNQKELHYFDEKVDLQRSSFLRRSLSREVHGQRWRKQVRAQLPKYRGGVRAEDVRWDARYFLRRPNDEWYANLFPQDGDLIRGEVTPDYSVLPRERVGHIHALMPDARIIFFTRNPIERAWSHALMEILRLDRQGGEGEARFVEHFRSERSRAFGDYLATIETWASFYPAERIFLGFLEDIHFRPKHLLERVFEFLGVEPGERYPYLHRVVHTANAETMPTRHAVTIADLYRRQVHQFADRVGGHAGWWRFTLMRLLDDPPDAEELAYPFWDSALWDEWERTPGRVGRGTPHVQSAPLSEVLRDVAV